MNPYASEDFNRIKLTPKPKTEDDGKIDHPLIEGKKMDITPQELKTFTKAMETKEFRELMNGYVDEISDPKHRPEQDQYLRELEERGELPPGTELIQPKAGFCIKTFAKKMVSDVKKSFFEQKTFVNVCWHDVIEKPEQKTVTQNGKKGTSWQLPYRVSKGKHDRDNKDVLCMTYDVVFHGDVANFLVYPEFKKFVADTAIDGVNRVLSENKEKLSADYKILKHINCKGVAPQMMTVKTKKTVENSLLKNMDVSKMETKLQKEIAGVKSEQQAKEAAQAKRDSDLKAAQADIDNGESEESGDEVEPRPKGIVQPKYKVVHSYPHDIMDSWEGHQGTLEQAKLEGKAKVPNELTVTIYATHAENVKQAKLDINESTLVFEYPGLYYLDLNLKYLCNPNKGSAKFDKTKKTLTIRMPVIGLTEDSQKVMDKNYEDFVAASKAKEAELKNLEMSKLEEELAARTEKKKYRGNNDDQEDQENAGDAQNKEEAPRVFSDEDPEAAAGVSKTKFIQSIDGDSKIDDKYMQDNEIDKNEEQEEKGKDLATIKREEFLNIYKEEGAEDKSDDTPDLSGGIKFKQGEEDSGFELKTSSGGAKPLIQELGSQTPEQVQKAELKKKADMPKEIPFSWDKAEIVELKTNFITHSDFVFVNLSLKGYKEEDVRYALSSDELLLEIRDRSAPRSVSRVMRLCQTLSKQIDVGASQINLLVDFINIKLAKQEKGSSWGALGFDVANFNIPKRGQMKSNFLKPLVVEEEKPVIKEEPVEEQPKELTEEELAEKKEQEIQRQIERTQNNTTAFMSLDTSSIFSIF